MSEVAAAKGTHVSWGRDPHTECIVSWRGSGDSVRVHGLAGIEVLDIVSLADIATGDVHRHAHISGLSPGRSIEFQVIDTMTGARGPAYRYRTIPLGRSPIRFTAFGDHGATPEAWRLAERVAQFDPWFHLHPGDVAYANAIGSEESPLDPGLWDSWLDGLATTAGHIPWVVAPGNHDVAPPRSTGQGPDYSSWILRFPSSGPEGTAGSACYRCGALAIVVLDSNDVTWEYPALRGGSSGAQTRWLDEVLKNLSTDPTVDLIIAMCHYPAFASDRMHGSDGGVRTEWSPLFDAYGVDLVLSGHNHGYERTAQVDAAGRTNPEAPIYLSVGTGGQVRTRWDRGTPSYRPGRSMVWTPRGVAYESALWSRVRVARNALIECRTEIDPGNRRIMLRIRAVDLDGSVLDDFRVRSRRGPLE